MRYNLILDLEQRARHKGAFAPVTTQKIKHNYLKYHRIAKIYITKKHKISPIYLELLMFIYSERPFSRKMFDEFDYTSAGQSRFESMMYYGYVTIFRKHVTKEAALYCITHKGKKIMDEYYSVLEGRNLKTVLSFIESVGKAQKRVKSMKWAVERAIKEKYDPTEQLRPLL